ncbi:hypothetical protein VTL71DRAFT_7731 [Oculimacula yallundae]|uniref:Uncharacterized protein n=1 Tax=Oculimacula yallundae TaxID=86028 RepID=A0ABR4CVH9_9HELO
MESRRNNPSSEGEGISPYDYLGGARNSSVTDQPNRGLYDSNAALYGATTTMALQAITLDRNAGQEPSNVFPNASNTLSSTLQSGPVKTKKAKSLSSTTSGAWKGLASGKSGASTSKLSENHKNHRGSGELGNKSAKESANKSTKKSDHNPEHDDFNDSTIIKDDNEGDFEGFADEEEEYITAGIYPLARGSIIISDAREGESLSGGSIVTESNPQLPPRLAKFVTDESGLAPSYVI